MSHIDNYRANEEYAAFLEGWDEGFFAKYADALSTKCSTARVLDVGCGVGQVVKTLRERGIEASGVDVSEPNIRKANELVGHCSLYDGARLPFSAAEFDSVGAFNVLEHVDEPEGFIAELTRVLRPGGRLVLSSPNFLRVLGYRDYHVRMRGLRNKWNNLRTVLSIRRSIRQAPHSVRFERMPPIVKEPFTPDDDAIVVTNPLHMAFFIEQAGCRVDTIECTDRYVAKPVQLVLNLPILKFLWFNSFLTATKA